VVISRHQGLKGNINEELNIGRAVAKAGSEKVKELVWFHPKEPDLNLDRTITSEMLSEDILGLYNASQSTLVFRKEGTSVTSLNESPVLIEHSIEGSNNWVISGSRTESGFPYLANDPHRAITSPSLRYMVHLSAPGWNVIGGGEPVIPGVSIGHNDHGAWGLTIFKTDAEDLFVYDLNPENLLQYKYKGNWKTMEKITEKISVKGAPDTLVTLLYSIHGPVTFIDSARKKAYAVKCAWLEPGGAPYLASLRINQAKNWKQFRKACEYSHLPGENMIWADKKGNIGWQAVGIIPVRKNFSGMVPVSGDGRYEWKRFQKIKKRPHLLNPQKGFFASSNQDVTPGNYKLWKTIGYSWSDPFRGNRINEVLSADTHRTLTKEMSLQTDYFSIPARTLVPFLQEVKFSNALAEKSFHRLKYWDFILDKNSVEAGIYAIWERVLSTRANKQFIPAELQGLISIQLSRLIGWLQHPDHKFGAVPESRRNEFIRETFEDAVNDLKNQFGDQVSNWTYGQDKFKHITLYNPLHYYLSPDLQEKYTLGPLPRGGNSYTVNSTGPSDNQESGASFRIIADVGDWDKTLMINSPGQSSDPESKYYDNLFKLWANDDFFPAYFSKDKILFHTDQRTILSSIK
ncbi:MAG: penicillin acylase family protein, partial [Ginsengibacter sp.]